MNGSVQAMCWTWHMTQPADSAQQTSATIANISHSTDETDSQSGQGGGMWTWESWNTTQFPVPCTGRLGYLLRATLCNTDFLRRFAWVFECSFSTLSLFIFKFIYLLFGVCVCMCVCLCVCICMFMHACGGQRKSFESLFFPPTIWVPRTDSGQQASIQVSLPAEPAWHTNYILYFF